MTFPDQKLNDDYDNEQDSDASGDPISVDDLIAYRKELVRVIERSIKAVEEIDKRIDELNSDQD